ncbi:SGNH/GDSL hydrolase family protein [Calothrix sp. 336/3]|uniref:SGNH/GDSL hydrolase family protein n=1 Tax=Calothrix sp. 336/3 TaxID=1337936 RepID=UPI0004E3F44F|nr:SGNH/GDSL hydrolase family protein [Calothrix sp. 336/3]AKG23362.1 hypothetical protein IJ00_20620 [Calothrix sp. 336/3]
MRKEFIAAGFVLFSFMLPQQASAANFTGFYVFGDSLSDTGNISKLSGSQFPPNPPQGIQPPYFQGRFSNNKNWVDYVGEELNLTPSLIVDVLAGQALPTQGINFAIGGSSSGLNNIFVPNEARLPGVLGQVATFTNTFQVDPNALYAVWGGGNDYLFGGETDTTNTVNNLATSVSLLAQKGAKNIVVFNLPNLGDSPIGSLTNNSKGLNLLTAQHNNNLATALGGISAINPNLNLISIDINSGFKQIQNNPSQFKLTNTQTPCLQGTDESIRAGVFTLCSNPEEFLFFDAVHPTTVGHNLIARGVLSAIHPKAVSEPTTAWGLLGLGMAMGTAGVIKRKHKVSSLQKV